MAKTPYIAMEAGEKFTIGLRLVAPDLASGETISTIVTAVVPAAGLTLVGDPTIDGDEVLQVIEAVTVGEYVVTFTTTTSAGNIYIDDYSVKTKGYGAVPGALWGSVGDVRGPGSAVDNAVARFNLTTGKDIQSSLAIIDDAGKLATPTVAADGIDLAEVTPPASPAANTIRIYAVDDNGFTRLIVKDSGGVTRNLTGDNEFVAYNPAVGAIPIYTIVYATGSFNDVPTVAAAQSNSTTTMPAIGVAVEEIAPSGYGRIMQIGVLENVNTAAWSAGDVLYVSPSAAGVATTTIPVYPNIKQEIGTVLVDDASVGKVQLVARGSDEILIIGTDVQAWNANLDALSARVQFAAAAPVAGTYLQGDIVFNTGATPGGFVGWVCTTGGTPGTWKTFGVISI